jgi:GT2 family glycosyltransferase
MAANNVEAYLPAAIDSVLAQTFTDLEVIVVDDGSTDATREVAERYASVEPRRVKVVSQPNAGLAGARNAALARASGDFLAILDSDDAWDAGFLASQMVVFDSDPGVAIVTGNARYLGGPLDGRPARPTASDQGPITLLEILGNEQAVFIMSVIRRAALDAIGGFDARFQRNEDYDLWIRAAAAGFRFARNPEPLGSYRVRNDSLSASEAAMLEGILRIYAKHRHAWAPGSAERETLERQVARFDTRLLEVRAARALEEGDFAEATRCLRALHARRGGAALTMALGLVRHAPALAARLYRLRRQVRGALAGPGGTEAGHEVATT